MICLDAFCHILPETYIRTIHRRLASPPHMLQRAIQIPCMGNLEERFRVMDRFEGYQQIPSLTSPPPEKLFTAEHLPDVVQEINESLASLVRTYPDRFPAYVATLPLGLPEATEEELQRLATQPECAGVQLYTTFVDQPLDHPIPLALIHQLSSLNIPIWLHPIRGPQPSEYPGEPYSRYDLWWSLGWPLETSLAMARLVFSGLFNTHPETLILTHHTGGLIPFLEGRFDRGMELLGTRQAPGTEWISKSPLKEKPVQALKRFYADTASFGSKATLECGRSFFGSEKLIFATDMPFDPEQGTGFIDSTLRAIHEMDLTAGEREKILHLNLKGVLRKYREICF